MRRFASCALVPLLAVCALVACSTDPTETDAPGAAQGRSDPSDAPSLVADAAARPSCATGDTAEGCPCTSGATASCWTGPVANRHVGTCKDGTRTCTGTPRGEFSQSVWGPCVGQVTDCGDAGLLTSAGDAGPLPPAGCHPSQKIAFVSCLPSGAAPSITPGTFSIQTIACTAVQTASALDAYDTIVYLGPIIAGALPAAVGARLAAGAKVIYFSSGNCDGASGGACKFNDNWSTSYDSLYLEDNIEFPETVATAKLTKPNTNAMNGAFSTATYGSYHVNHLMRASDPWCSDLVVTSQNDRRSTTFHGFLLDNATRKGLLIATTLDYVAAGNRFDFTEPFLAAHLNQPWSQRGDSTSCGLTCERDLGTAHNSSWSDVTGMGKPVIYLYPKKEETVHVRLDLNGQFVTTYPQYDDALHGWKVRARPDGQLVDLHNGREYSYLYWSGMSRAFQPSFDEGFVVPGDSTRTFLEDTLAKLGLTPRERNDMIVYWLPYMENHPYNLISFAHESYTDVAKLAVEPKPDSMLRVFMVFKKLEHPVDVKPQRIEPFHRKGFAVVEWGGSEIGGDWHVMH